MQKHLPVAVFNEIKRTFSETKSNDLKSTVNARIVHGWLGVKTEYAKWIQRRIEKFGFTEGIDYCTTIVKVGDRSNVVQVEYHCAPDMVKQLAMLENSEKGKLVRLYYLDCEVVAASKLAALEERRPPFSLMIRASSCFDLLIFIVVAPAFDCPVSTDLFQWHFPLIGPTQRV